MVLCYFVSLFCIILYPWLISKFDFRKLSTFRISCFLSQIKFLSQNWYFFQKVQSSLGEQKAKENFQKNLVILFWQFLIISLSCKLPQVKRYLISRITNLLKQLPYELLRYRIWRNQEILEKCRMLLALAQCPVFLPNIKR